MSNTKWKDHPNAPHNQPFNVGARKNKSKTKSWWNAGSQSFWRSKPKAKKVAAEATE